jgi:hypothetical protein
MGKKIIIKFGEREVIAELNESMSAELFYKTLPSNLSMTRWGDEFYGNCRVPVDQEKDARTDMEIGELALWPEGSALCIFFGPTPVSRGDKPKAISPVNPIGRIVGDVGFLKKFPSSIDIEIRPA